MLSAPSRGWICGTSARGDPWKEDRASKEPGLLSNDNPEFVTGPVFMLVEVFAREADYCRPMVSEFNPLRWSRR